MRPLDGVRVLDMSRVLAGPFAGRILSDLGAEVVKVEPPEGDVTRNWGLERAGLAGYFTQQNVGKRNICIDLQAEGGPDLIRQLAAEADILIENFRPGIMT
ncbi:MAG: CoA transferase, partial [Actinomycetota bacterium]|nr:CoA transferase [Actinomycetota bacterium]